MGFREEAGDAKWFEYEIRGLDEAIWRAIGYRDARTLREVADLLRDRLYELAEVMENGGPHS